MKKYILFSFLMGISSFAFAENLLKTCSYTIKIPGITMTVPTTFQIFKDAEKTFAKTTQIVDGKTVQLPVEAVIISRHSVRPNLNEETQNMNQAEQLILGTIGFLNNPEIGSSFNVGLDLKSIRQAKVYQVGEFTHMGGTAIIEAQDEEQKLMGSFVTGFFPFACK